MGLDGAMVQMVSHGLISGALFLCIGVLYDRMHSRQIADYGGVINTMPVFGAFMVLFAMANAGLPGTSGFVGEFLVILAAFQANFWYAFLAAMTLILGAAYTLWLVKRVVFGPVGNDHVAELQDLNGREFLVLGVLAVGGAGAGPVAGAAARGDATDDRATGAADDADEGLTMNPASITRLDLVLAAPEMFLLAATCVMPGRRPVPDRPHALDHLRAVAVHAGRRRAGSPRSRAPGAHGAAGTALTWPTRCRAC